MCISYMKKSTRNTEYSVQLAVSLGCIARDVYNSEVPNVSVIFIAIRLTMKDDIYQRGIACGFEVTARCFLVGAFEGCACNDPRAITRWNGHIHMKGKFA